MPNFNKVIIAGHLTRDPQLKYLPSGDALCEFGIAVSEKWKDKAGESKGSVCFVDAKLFGKQAETFNQHMAKGRPVLIEGKLAYDTWNAQDGSKRSKHTVKVERFTFLGAKPGGQPDASAASNDGASDDLDPPNPIVDTEPPF